MVKRTAHAVIAGALALATAATLGAAGTGAGPGSAVDRGDAAGAEARGDAGSRVGTARDSGDASRVVTDKGAVRGTVTDAVRVFQGIPYAAPPVGERRWAPPGPVQRWRGVRDATERGAACPQTGLVPPVGPASDDEDCLFVNVTAPRTPSAKPRPVMVYLHGGDHTDGEGAMHGARRLAARGDVIVVTVNYRLAALGYLAHPDLEARGESGNYGFLDQQAALRWVRRNAAAFGGDPRSVTLFGESAGGYSACAHLVAPSSAGLFDRVILQSAPCTADMGARDREEALKEGVAAAAGIEKRHGLDDWRRASPRQLVHPFGAGPTYTPVYGGALLPRTPREAFAAGRFNKVPVLHGVNRHEERARVYGLELAKQADTGDPDAQIDRADYHTHLEREFGAERAAAVAARYPVSAYDGSPALALAAALTDGLWARHSVDTGRALSRHVRTYGYEFADHEVPWYSDANYRKPRFEVGAAHTFELPYLFELDAYTPLTPAQRTLSDEMIRIWAEFARTGRADWRSATPASPNVRSLASGPGGIRPVDFAKDHHDDFWKSLFGKSPR
ncbi:carboxylesterase/lipase family protein [Streptomyces tritici]|uniref:carboxylesterase/lipase family protein n=1 Tax=Streptomyces tritici TaxID=2054410 RepID=UPI003AF0A200